MLLERCKIGLWCRDPDDHAISNGPDYQDLMGLSDRYKIELKARAKDERTVSKGPNTRIERGCQIDVKSGSNVVFWTIVQSPMV